MTSKARRVLLFLVIFALSFFGALYLGHLGVDGPWSEEDLGLVGTALPALVFAWITYSAVSGCGPWVVYFPIGIGVCLYLFGEDAFGAIAGLLLGASLVVLGDRALRPAWRSNSKERRFSAIDSVADQKTLARIALEAKHSDASLRAVDRLTDQSLLLGLLEQEKSAELKEAFGFSSDELEDAVRKRIVELRRREIRAIDDPRALRQIVETEDDLQLRLAALGRIDDPQILAELAREDTRDSVREAAIERISDDRILASIAAADSSESVWRGAYSRLEDEALKREVRAVRFLPSPSSVSVIYVGPKPHEAWVEALIEKCQGLLTVEQLLSESRAEFKEVFPADREDFLRHAREAKQAKGGLSIDVLVLDQAEGHDTAAFATWTGDSAASVRRRLRDTRR